MIGKTGVGKSSLINSVFRGDFARTGVGRPVTENIRTYPKRNCQIIKYDNF
ncbi:hypothetical protein ACO1ZR_28380 [Klebsiella quasipneumoniae]|uniref:hypothetical protein n=1 Tax=Klebsiella quasipneumoniae TaxID=1463165 RepID=UPI003BF66681